MSILSISASGIRALTAFPKFLPFISEYDNDAEKRELEIQENASLANKEIELGFPNLNAFAMMSIWSLVESFIVDLVVLWIQNRPEVIIGYKDKIKIDICEFLSLDERERAYLIVDQIQRENGGKLKIGAGRFNSVLELVAISIRLDDEKSKHLIEFQQYRNCLAHRFGIVDRKFLNSCPWVELKDGDRVVINSESMKKYFLVAADIIGKVADQATDRLKLEE